QAVIEISNFFAGDVLNFTDTATITGSYDGAGTLTLSSTNQGTGDTLAAYQTALQSITYSSTSDDPTSAGANTARTIYYHVRDIHNAASTNDNVFRTVNVTGVNNAPTVSAPASIGVIEDVASALT